ncbi:MAG: HAMP domain-containing protein [Melioribacteraceae bacterium]|nr:HAMP domain-containing protein [Melioribacteraceae bacterium]
MKKNNYISLKFKLTFVNTVLLALISMFVYYYFPKKFEEDRLKGLEEKANSIVKIASYAVSSGLNLNDYSALEEKIESFFENQQIVYTMILKNQSIIYAYNEFFAALNDYRNDSGESKNTRWDILKTSAEISMDGERFGKIYMGLSLTSFRKEMNELKENIIMLSLIIFILGSLLSFLIIWIFTKPLNGIVLSLNKIADGDYSQRIKIISNDEIGYLSSSFNEMIEKVQSSNEEMEIISKELEQRVTDRTKELEGALKSLQKENLQRRKIENEISKSLTEKEVLLKEIHHRVKNNLQIVSSLFFFQSKQVTDPKMLEMFRDGQNRVKSMALIHEKLYQSGDLANIDFKEYIKKLSNFLLQSYGVNQSKIKLKNNVQQVFLGVDTAVPCGLIINELISNSLKHGFTNMSSGEIRIDMGHNEHDQLILKISDNGKGIPKNLNIEQSDSLGLRLVYNLTTQLNGKVEFFNNNGTTVKIVFPDPALLKAS